MMTTTYTNLSANPMFSVGLLGRLFADFVACPTIEPPKAPEPCEIPDSLPHLMIDVETWGTTPGCAIRSIGAVAFDLFGTDYKKLFYVNVTDNYGFLEDETIEFWRGLTESQPEMKTWLSNPTPYYLETSLDLLFNFFKRANTKYVWCHGASFDEPIIRAVARKAGINVPWDHRNIRDTRTLYDLAGFNSDDAIMKRDPKIYRKHHALDNALYQAECVRRVFNVHHSNL